MRGAKQTLLALFLLGLGACTQTPPERPKEVVLAASLTPEEVAAVGPGPVQLTLRLTAQGLEGEVELSLEGSGLALSPDRLPAKTGDYPLRLEVFSQPEDQDLTAKLAVKGGGKRVELPLRVRYRVPLRASLLAESPLALVQGRERAVALELEPRRPLSGALSLRTSEPWLTATAAAAAPPEGGTVPIRLSVSPNAPLGKRWVTLWVSWGGETASLRVQVEVQEPPPTPPPPDFSLAVSPSRIGLAPGQEGTVGLAVLRTGGLEGEVVLTLEGPSLLSPWEAAGPGAVGWRLEGTGDSRTLRLKVGQEVPPGSLALRVKGALNGLTREAPLTLEVRAPSPPPPPPPQPGFRISLEPTALTVPQGGRGTLTLTLTPEGGFRGEVALSLEGGPAGLDLSPKRVSVAGGAAATFTLTLSVPAQAPTGSYPVTLRAEGGGARAEASLGLTVYTLRLGEVELGQSVVLPASRWREWNLPILAGKVFLVRVHLTAEPGPVRVEAPLSGELEVGPPSGPPRFQAPISFRCPERLPAATDPGNLESTCHAVLPKEFIPQAAFGADRLLELRLSLRTKDGQERRETVPVHRPFRLKVTLVPAVLEAADPSNPYHGVVPDPERVAAVARGLSDQLARYFPISAVEVRVREPATYQSEYVSLGRAYKMAVDLNVRENGIEGASRQIYVALVPITYEFAVGIGGYTLRHVSGSIVTGDLRELPVRTAAVAMAIAMSDSDAWQRSPEDILRTIAHEVGHSLGLLHARGCGASYDVDPNYPYPDGSVGVYNFNPITLALEPPTLKDIVSICGMQTMGISDYHYRNSYRLDPALWNYPYSPPPSLESIMVSEP